MEEKLNPLALGLALGILDAACMLILSLLGRFGYGQSAVWITMNFIPGYSLSFSGIVIGALFCGVVSFVLGYAVAYLYNLFAQA